MFVRTVACVVFGALTALGASQPATAQSWPQRPVHFIFPYASGGGGPEAIARILAQRFADMLGQPFIVESQPGANGAIAASAVARAPADGHMLFWATTPQIAISPAMTKTSYDPIKDFAPISAVLTNNFALVVNPNVPVHSVGEFVQYFRAQSSPSFYAEGGIGSISHLGMALLLRRADLQMINVTYKGDGPALMDVIAGHVPACFCLLSSAQEQATAGALRVLAVATEQRLSRYSEIATLSESGFLGFSAASWQGLMAPAGTPKHVVDRIATEVARAVKDPEIADRIAALGLGPIGNSPEEFAAMIAADIALWGEAVRVAGLAKQ